MDFFKENNTQKCLKPGNLLNDIFCSLSCYLRISKINIHFRTECFKVLWEYWSVCLNNHFQWKQGSTIVLGLFKIQILVSSIQNKGIYLCFEQGYVYNYFNVKSSSSEYNFFKMKREFECNDAQS